MKKNNQTGETAQVIDHLFTPRDKKTDERLTMSLNAADDRAVSPRTRGYRGTVTDQLTGKRYKVYGAECSIPRCCCDATVEEVKEKGGLK